MAVITKSSTNGLRGKVKQILSEMNRIRGAKEKARDVTLRQFLAEKYEGIEPGHLYAELQIEPSFTTVGDLYNDDDAVYLMPEIMRDSMRRGLGQAQREWKENLKRYIASQAPVQHEGNGGQRWITPEIFYEPIMRGSLQAPYYQDLIIREVSVPQPSVTMPYFDLSNAQLVESEEGATIEEGTVTFGTKTVLIGKEAKGIKYTYESIMWNTLDLVEVYFRDFGRRLGARLNNKAVLNLINGEQSNLSEAAAVIGVENTTNKFTYEDLVRVAIRFQQLGRTLTTVIANENTARRFMLLPEVKDNQFNGQPIVRVQLRNPLPSFINVFVSPKVPANQYILLDDTMAQVQLTAQPLMLETEKIVSKQIQGTWASIYTGFAMVYRDTRVVVDESIAYSGNTFPSWMAAIDE